MKEIICFMFSMTLAFTIYSQSIPPININNLTPKWYHVLKDSNFVQDTFGSNIRNEYSVCNPNLYKVINNQLLVNCYCIFGYGAFYGNLINRIDLKTGKMEWARALNNDNYLEEQEFFPNLFYDKLNNDIVLTGFKKIAPLQNSWSLSNQPSLSSSIRLDYDLGTINSHIVNENIDDTLQWSVLKGNFVQSSSNKYYYAERIADFSAFKYNIYEILPNQQFVSSPGLTFTKPNVGTYYYNAGFDNILSDADQNDNLYSLILNNYTGKNDSISARFIKFKINEDDNIENTKLDVVYEKEINDYFQLPESPFGFLVRHLIGDDASYITGAYLDTLDYKVKTWVLGLDGLGREKFYIKTLTFDNMFFPSSVRFIARKNGKVYLIVNGDDSSNSRILMSIDDNGQIKQHSIYKSADPNTFIEGFSGFFTENDEIVLSVRTYKKYNHIVCYDAKDFGIDFSSSTDAITDQQDPYKIYPNPTLQTITIQSEKETNGTFYLNDAMGRLVRKMTLQGTHTTLDLSDLPSGIYNLKLPSDDHAKVLFHKVVKW